jgi:hypothetical protein
MLRCFSHSVYLENSGKLSVSQVRAKTGKVAMSAHSTFTDRGGGV